jgi:hypothetical protein
MKKTKQLSARISELANALLEMEQKKTNESQGAIIERCIFNTLRRPEAVQIIRDMARKDPTLMAILEAYNTASGAE